MNNRGERDLEIKTPTHLTTGLEDEALLSLNVTACMQRTDKGMCQILSGDRNNCHLLSTCTLEISDDQMH